MINFIKGIGVILLLSLVFGIGGAALGGFAWFILISFFGQWLSLRYSLLLSENYMIFIVIGALIGLIRGISGGLEIIKAEQKNRAWKREWENGEDSD